MRRGSLTIESLQRLLPSVARRMSSSRDQLDITGKSGEFLSSSRDIPLLHEGFHKSSSWNSVQSAILHLFDQRSMTILERTLLCENMKSLCETEIGPFIYEHYKIHLMPRGLEILRNKITQVPEKISVLVDVWNNFYREILPLLQTVFLPVTIQATSLGFKEVTLLGFRDNVLLKLPIEDIAGNTNLSEEQTAALSQMFLVLQHVRETWGFTENGARLEKLVARLVKPYIGEAGLYDGEAEPTILSGKAVHTTSNSHDYHGFRNNTVNPKLLHLQSYPDHSTSSMTSLRPSDDQEVIPASSSYDSRIRNIRRHSVQFDLSLS